MPTFPLHLETSLGPIGAVLVYLAIGFAFGFVLEIAGFGNSRKLAAQFYFKEMTVLKVMFTAIVVAMVLIFGASALGWLDYNLIWVNETYLWPGIVGGLIMGVGFIIGGFCPGTSLVSAATFKIDGLLFALGAVFGIFLFGETVGSFELFWNSSYLGRLTLPQVFSLRPGVVVVLVVLMALFMFWGGEQLEHIFGGRDLKREPKLRYAGAGALLVAALAVMAVRQPTNADRWARVEPEREDQLVERQAQLQPGEVLNIMHDHQLKLVMLDVRTESDYNLFHLADAEHVHPENLIDRAVALRLEPANTVFLLMSNDETAATDAWRVLVAESVPNVYILEGGINGWLDVFATQDPGILPGAARGDDTLRYEFAAALGAAHAAAYPDPHEYDLQFEPRLKLELKRGPTGGGCG